MRPGRYDNLPNEMYHRSKDPTDGVSKSGLMIFRHCPSNFKAVYIDEDGIAKTPSPAMLRGIALHCLLLEPRLFAKEYVCGPDIRKGTKAWKEFEDSVEGKNIINKNLWDEIHAMADAINDHPEARRYITALAGKTEVSFYWRDPKTKVMCKCRPDKVIEE